MEALKENQPSTLLVGRAHSGYHRAGHYVCVWKRGQRSTGVGSGVKDNAPIFNEGPGKGEGVSVATGWNQLSFNGQWRYFGGGDGLWCLGISDLEDDDLNVHMDPVPIPCLGISRGIPVARIATGGRHSAFVSLPGRFTWVGKMATVSLDLVIRK